MADDKQKIINDIYFDRAGFQSKSNTLKDAREKDKTYYERHRTIL